MERVTVALYDLAPSTYEPEGLSRWESDWYDEASHRPGACSSRSRRRPRSGGARELGYAVDASNPSRHLQRCAAGNLEGSVSRDYADCVAPCPATATDRRPPWPPTLRRRHPRLGKCHARAHARRAARGARGGTSAPTRADPGQLLRRGPHGDPPRTAPARGTRPGGRSAAGAARRPRRSATVSSGTWASRTRTRRPT